jgi:hypothetical protein
MEDSIMRTPEEFAGTDADLITDHRCRDEIAARRAEILGKRKGGRKHHGGGMEDRTVMDIVLLGNVRRGGIHQGSEERRSHCARGQDLSATDGRAHGGCEPL